MLSELEQQPLELSQEGIDQSKVYDTEFSYVVRCNQTEGGWLGRYAVGPVYVELHPDILGET